VEAAAHLAEAAAHLAEAAAHLAEAAELKQLNTNPTSNSA
jgi:hypothetical protein